MKNVINLKQNKFANLFKLLIIFAIITGVFCRFYNLDGKALSNDETFSSTYIYGQSLAGVIDNQIISVEELQNYQRVNAQESLTDSLHRLITKPYVFPPLYGILMQPWARFWGQYTNNPAVISRSLSVLFGLLAFPCIYWLCRELSESTILPWIATAMLAVSPFHLQYSQIVRTYSLTVAVTLLASAALLRAIRHKTRSGWIIYAITLATGLYANLLFGFVGIAHAAYVFCLEKFRFTKTFQSYLLASLGGGAAFLPWFILFISSPGLIGYSVAQVVQKSSSISLLTIWLKNIRPIFIDLYDPWVEFTSIFANLQKLLFLFLLILVLVAFISLGRHWSKPISIFIFCLIGFGGVMLMIKDAIAVGTFSTRLRYMIPYVLGIELAVAYFLAIQLASSQFLTRKLAETAVFLLIIGGIISCFTIAHADSWWAFGAPDSPAIARTISKSDRPVIIFEDWGDALTMSYLLDKNVYSHLTRKGDVYLIQERGKLYDEFSDIFLFKPSQQLQDKLQQNSELKMELISASDPVLAKIRQVWHVEKL